AMVHLQEGQLAEALQRVDRAVELQPRSVSSWELKGEILERANRSSEALEAYTRGLDLQPATTNKVTLERQHALLNRARMFKKLGRLREAGEDVCAAYMIPAREALAGPSMVDLSAFYNAGLTSNWSGDQTDNELSELPPGIQTLAGTSYDIRG